MKRTTLHPRAHASAEIARRCASSPAPLSACSSVETRTYPAMRIGAEPSCATAPAAPTARGQLVDTAPTVQQPSVWCKRRLLRPACRAAPLPPEPRRDPLVGTGLALGLDAVDDVAGTSRASSPVGS